MVGPKSHVFQFNKHRIFFCYGLWITLSCCSCSLATDMFPMTNQQQFSGVDKTNEVFGLDNDEFFPVAYCDLNSDQLIDIVTISRDRTAIDVFLGFNQPPFLRRALVSSSNITEKYKDKIIISVRPGDFTGNGIADIMLTLGKEKYTPDEYFKNDTSVVVVFCEVTVGSNSKNRANIHCGGPGSGAILKDLVQEPMVLDLNGDMVLDLVGELWEYNRKVKTRKIWLSQSSKESFEWRNEIFQLAKDSPWHNESLRHMINASSNVFADMDGDDIPELTFIVEDAGDRSKSYRYIETFQIVKDSQEHIKFQFKMPPTLFLTEEHQNQIKVLGQPHVFDFEHKGKLNYLLPFCSNYECTHFGIYVVGEEGNTTELPLESFRYEGAIWNFIHPPIPPTDSHHNASNATLPMESFYSKTLSLRIGDYNLDGYPDLLGVVVKHGDPSERMTRAVLLENVACAATPSKPCQFTRTFSPNFEIFKDYPNVISASFYDIGDNGALDVLLVSQNHWETVPQKQKFVGRAIENEMNFDASFLKVTVLTGQFCLFCESGIPYGNVLPGATIKYSSHNTRGTFESGVMVQTFRTSHMPLDLPSCVFGIGQSPNFIDVLSVAVAPNAADIYRKDWLQLIPNSQVVVVPSPLEKPNQWIMKLYLTPSGAALKAFTVLVGICLILGVLASALEYKERREDRLLRQGEAHRLVM